MLALDYPYVEVGDEATLESWRADGADDTNTDRGVVYVESVAASGLLTVNVYRAADKSSGDLVATGSAAAGARATLAAANGSRLSMSVKVVEAQARSTIRLHLMLASQRDMEEREDRVLVLLNADRITFADIARATSRAFLTRMAERFQPPVSAGRAQGFPGTSPWQEAGHFGRPADTAPYFLWALNGSGAFEMVGLTNATDYREWAINDSLARIWQMKSQGGADDPMLQRAAFYQRQAADEWARITPWIDMDSNATPDRPARTKSIRMRRG